MSSTKLTEAQFNDYFNRVYDYLLPTYSHIRADDKPRFNVDRNSLLVDINHSICINGDRKRKLPFFKIGNAESIHLLECNVDQYDWLPKKCETILYYDRCNFVNDIYNVESIKNPHSCRISEAYKLKTFIDNCYDSVYNDVQLDRNPALSRIVFHPHVKIKGILLLHDLTSIKVINKHTIVLPDELNILRIEHFVIEKFCDDMREIKAKKLFLKGLRDLTSYRNIDKFNISDSIEILNCNQDVKNISNLMLLKTEHVRAPHWAFKQYENVVNRCEFIMDFILEILSNDTLEETAEL